MPASRKLIIVESPAKANTIAKFLGRGYKVEASQGHVRDLPKSRLGVDVDKGFELKYITIHGRGEILARLRKEARTASTILLATDPDREGEAISWHLAQALKIDPEKPCRVEFNEITKKAVTEAVKSPRAIDMRLVDAQQARRALDRLVGYKISPLLWAKVRKGLSAGRVQSVAARMVVDREEEISGFIPEEFWNVSASVQATGGKQAVFTAKLTAIEGSKPLLSTAEEAHSARDRLTGAGNLRISDVRIKEKRKQPSAPFITSTLQQEASRKLGFTIARTMRVAQALYEGVSLKTGGHQGLITYMRTDSVRVSEEALTAVREHIRDRFGPEYLPDKPNVFKGRPGAQDAHEAIRPTDVNLLPENIKESLTREQLQLYKLIHRRFLASQMSEALYDTQTVEMEGDGLSLRHYGERKRFAGFTGVYEEGTDDAETVAETGFPEVSKGDAVTVLEAEAHQHFTQPPPRYTEASLVRALEEQGIGRPSTYAPVLSTIVSRGYVTRENKRLYPTELGFLVNSLMTAYFSPIVDTGFTAGLEAELDAVEEGKKPWGEVLEAFYPSFEGMLASAEAEMEKLVIEDEKSDTVCDQCGALMVYKNGRFGRFLACPNFPECRNTLPILHYIDAPCPDCGARLLEKTSRKNRKFYGCERYPECGFTSWEMPVAERCPVCGSYMTLKRKKGDSFLLCANAQCRHSMPRDDAAGGEDDD